LRADGARNCAGVSAAIYATVGVCEVRMVEEIECIGADA